MLLALVITNKKLWKTWDGNVSILKVNDSSQRFKNSAFDRQGKLCCENEEQFKYMLSFLKILKMETLLVITFTDLLGIQRPPNGEQLNLVIAINFLRLLAFCDSWTPLKQ